jgi:hypothetical protein
MTHQSTANRDPAVAQQIGRDYALGLLNTKKGAVELAYSMLCRVPSVILAGYLADLIMDVGGIDAVHQRFDHLESLRQLAIRTASNQAYENAFAGDAQRSVASLTVPVPTLEFCNNEQVDATLRSRLDGLGIDYPTYQHFTNAYTLLREFVSGLRCAGLIVTPAFYDALKRAEDTACQKFGIPF